MVAERKLSAGNFLRHLAGLITPDCIILKKRKKISPISGTSQNQKSKILIFLYRFIITINYNLENY